MTKDSITDFEDAINKAKEEFLEAFKTASAQIQSNQLTHQDLTQQVTNLHGYAVRFFNLFGRSINEYNNKAFHYNTNIRNSKLDDAINISNTIVKYWGLLQLIHVKYGILIPKPSERAYYTIQLFIKKFDEAKAEELKKKFEQAGLPINGFESKRKFTDMSKKQQIKYGIIVGTVFLVALLIISLIVKCPTSAQDRIFTTILALAAAAFSAAIPGFINVKYREMITASGALAVFVIVFLVKPAQLSDFKSCVENIKGTVYYGDSPAESIDIMFIKQSVSTKTDNFGNFNAPVNLSSVEGAFKIRLVNANIQLDTIVNFEKANIGSSLDIMLKQYCVHCTQNDEYGKLVKSDQKCSASYTYISRFIEGYTKAAQDQGRTAQCKLEVK